MTSPAVFDTVLNAVGLSQATAATTMPRFRDRAQGAGAPATHVRLKIFPDGGVARLRLYGSLTETGLAAMRRRWDETA